MNEFATAPQHWDQQWADPAKRAAWEQAEDRVLAVAHRPRDHGAKYALDLGCGVGRHALALAEMGYGVEALDGAPTGLERVREAARARDLNLNTHQGEFTDLPYPDGQFDYVLSWNVIYHGDEEIVKTAIAEIHRVLRPGGIYQGTMLSKRNANYGVGQEVAPDTWVNGGVLDKAHPHYYCDAKTLLDLFGAFEALTVDDYEQRPGAFHWHIVAEKPFAPSI